MLEVDVRFTRRALDLAVALTVRDECVAIIGPSGAGKSTLLRLVAGLERPDDGRIAVHGRAWFDAKAGVNLSPERRSVGMAVQEYALFPHMNVAQNVAFGGTERDAVQALERLSIGHLSSQYPAKLSGGERQRVALARALARHPAVLALDEPMSALDPVTRAQVRDELAGILTERTGPTLIVTHDFEAASILARRVLVLSGGRVVQEGTPERLVARPADAVVAGLTGANLIPGRARAGSSGLSEVTLDQGTVIYSADRLDGPVWVSVHPSDITLSHTPPMDSSMNRVQGPVTSVSRIANRARVAIGVLVAEVTTTSVERLGLVPGAPVVAAFKATATSLLPQSREQLAASDQE